MQIGRKIYYDILTGDVLVDTGEKQGDVVETTIDHDIKVYTALSERNRKTYDVIELEFGQYSQDFTECNGFRVNPETKVLEFSYPNPNEPNIEQPYQLSLSEKVKQLEEAQIETNVMLLDFMEASFLG